MSRIPDMRATHTHMRNPIVTENRIVATSIGDIEKYEDNAIANGPNGEN